MSKIGSGPVNRKYKINYVPSSLKNLKKTFSPGAGIKMFDRQFRGLP